MKIGILCTKYLENISKNFKKMLLYLFSENNNIEMINLYFSINELINSDDDFYIIIASQFFKNLLPFFKNKKFCIYQLEQLNKIKLDKELVKLSNHVLDYTEINRSIYQNYKILYPPFSCYDSNVIKEEKQIDILFYGCLNSRRRNILSHIKKKFNNLQIITNKRDEELYQLIRKSKIVLNISYYKPSIFEIARINEIIPLGTFIISELNLIDDFTKKMYENEIFFIKNIENNLQKLVETIQFILDEKKESQNYNRIINEINSHNKNILYNILYNV